MNHSPKFITRALSPPQRFPTPEGFQGRGGGGEAESIGGVGQRMVSARGSVGRLDLC